MSAAEKSTTRASEFESERVSTAEIRRGQRAALRKLMDELVTLELSLEQRRQILNWYHRGARRVIQRAARGDDIGARAALGMNSLFLEWAAEHPLELLDGADLAQDLEPEIRQYERNSIEHSADLVRLGYRASLFCHLRRAAHRYEKHEQERLKNMAVMSAQARRESNLARDCRIRELHAEGKKPKEIAELVLSPTPTPEGFGNAVALVRRVLRSPHP